MRSTFWDNPKFVLLNKAPEQILQAFYHSYYANGWDKVAPLKKKNASLPYYAYILPKNKAPLHKVLHQVLGIGMGPPGSPANCMAVCIYFEKQFLDSIYDFTRFIAIVRYFDDLRALVAVSSNDPNSRDIASSLLHDLQHSCYHILL